MNMPNIFQKKYDTGLILDARPAEEKEKDYLHEEIAAGAAESVYGQKSDVKMPYQQEDQRGTLSCVAHADTLNLGIDNELEGEGFARLSKAFFYRLRANYPAGGMAGVDAGNIAANAGTCLFETLPTPATETEINKTAITQAMITEAKTFRAKNYVAFAQYNDIDVLNSVVSQGKAVTIFIYATYREWAREYPALLDKPELGSAPIQHAVCVLPKSGFIENGKKYLMIQDSAHFGGLVYRCLSAEFIWARCFFAKYFINLENKIAAGDRPVHTFTKVLRYGMNSEEVKWLQKCLAYEGLHPAQSCTGYFGGITLASVKKFQNKYAKEILAPLGLDIPTGIVGSMTIAKLNSLYAT